MLNVSCHTVMNADIMVTFGPYAHLYVLRQLLFLKNEQLLENSKPINNYDNVTLRNIMSCKASPNKNL